MPDLTNVNHHITVEELSEILCTRTGRDAPDFFRILAVYYMGVMASCMRATIRLPGTEEELPLNTYVTALAPSGFGKNKSISYLENHVFCDFRSNFRDFTMIEIAKGALWRRAIAEAGKTGNTEQMEFDKLESQYERCGEYPFTFDGGSEPAIKQVREKLLLAECGSLNLQIDELATNLEKLGTTEALATYLELYDKGYIKNKLTKNTPDNKRMKEIEGSTPANMLLFGTPTALFDAGPLEKRFNNLQKTGYARRDLKAWAENAIIVESDPDIDEIYKRLVDPVNQKAVQKWRNHFADLSDQSKLNWTITVSEDIHKQLILYQLECQKKAQEISEFDEARRAEMTHRYFRAIKVAGIYAFVEESMILTSDHLKAAIKLVEESGIAFEKMMSREPAYAKLARYFAAIPNEVTRADLMRDLPFYKDANKGERDEMLLHATAWGYREHIVIKTQYRDKIEFFEGETLEKTDLDSVQVSHSAEFGHGYTPEHGAFTDLPALLTLPNYNWASHTFKDGHRHGDDVIPGFNLAVFDIDGTVSRDAVHSILEDFVFLTQTTKRHTPDVNRFRLIMPLSYQLKLNKDDYQQFMDNLCSWLPFDVDFDASKDIVRKWATFEHADVRFSKGTQLLDILPFIPKTEKNRNYQKSMQTLASHDALERWFAHRYEDGNRSNMMIRFALALVSDGLTYPEIETRVLAFNGRLSNGLGQDELMRTVLSTTAKRLGVAA